MWTYVSYSNAITLLAQSTWHTHTRMNSYHVHASNCSVTRLTLQTLHGALPWLPLPAVMQSAPLAAEDWEAAGPGGGAEGRGWHT